MSDEILDKIKEKMNGSIGLVRKFTARDGTIRVEIVQQDGNKVSLSEKELDEFVASLKGFFPEKFKNSYK